MSFLESLFLVMLVLVLVTMIRNGTFQRGGTVGKQRRQIDDAFERMRRSQRWQAELVQAQLVHEVDGTCGSPPTVQVSQLYRNPMGTYFLFTCTAGKDGALTHLSRERAERMVKLHPDVHEREFGKPNADET